MAKKAKAKRRALVPTWIARDANGDYHAIVSHEKPHVLDDMSANEIQGDWVVGCGVGAIWGLRLCTDEYEASTPVKYHLKPGGVLKMKLVRA